MKIHTQHVYKNIGHHEIKRLIIKYSASTMILISFASDMPAEVQPELQLITVIKAVKGQAASTRATVSG